jgi:hypothetical protein
MNFPDDDLLELVGRLDPVRDELPPDPGSDRYRSILAVATRRRQRRWPRVAGVAAATAIVVTSAVALWPPGDGHSAAAAVRRAAEALDDVRSFEVEGTEVLPDIATTTFAVHIDGDDFEAVNESSSADGHVEEWTITAVDGVGYLTADGRTERFPLRPADGLDVPYGELSAALIAALDGADVTDGGTETVDDVVTTRYDIALSDGSTAALGALRPLLPEFDGPQDIVQLSVWIADNHLHRLETAYRDGRQIRITLFNLNRDIAITAPPGPYIEPSDD